MTNNRPESGQPGDGTQDRMGTGDRANEIASLLSRLAVLLTEAPAPVVPQPRTMPERVFLTVEEAAERLKIGRTKVYALVKTNELESVNIGRLRRIPVEAVNAYAAWLLASQQSTRSELA